jgi:hypothetical protein
MSRESLTILTILFTFSQIGLTLTTFNFGPIENEYNPVDIDQAGEPVKLIHNQINIGLSFIIRQHIKTAFNFSRGLAIHYSEYEQKYWEPYYTFFQHNDFQVIVTYFLKPN